MHEVGTMRHGWSGEVQYSIEGEKKIRSLRIEDTHTAHDDILTLTKEWREADGFSILTYWVKASVKVSLESAVFCRWIPDDLTESIGINGFQTWSESREYRTNELMHGLRRVFTPWIRRYGLRNYGDYSFSEYKPSHLHGYSWFYFRNPSGILFLGSLSERPGYTRFWWYRESSMLLIDRECEGLEISESLPILQLFIKRGTHAEVFNRYFQVLRVDCSSPPLAGWTSWYSHYSGIDEKTVRENLQSFTSLRLPADVFQIDDGWERAVGDWLEPHRSFPSGMGALAEEIGRAGFRPGLWLAPFIAEESSHVFQNHPEWFVDGKGGEPFTAGYNPFHWSGRFYILDIYNTDVEEYLREVFHTVIDRWGFRFLKLDFLYAAALLPRGGRSRGMIMDDAMELLKSLCGEVTVLGCGVPLESAFGRVQYCRIGADVALKWEDRKLKLLGYRERVSTVNSLRSTIGRWQLNNRAFVSDPDVYILRRENNQLSPRQRFTLFLVNQIYGGLLFTSDNPSEYDEETLALFRSQFPLRKKEIVTADESRVRFRIGILEYIAFHNLTADIVEHELPEGLFFSSEEGFTRGGCIVLQAYESRCFMIPSEEPYTLAGSTGLLFPGSEIEDWEHRDGSIRFSVNPLTQSPGLIMFRVPMNANGCMVNGRFITAEEKFDMKLVILDRTFHTPL